MNKKGFIKKGCHSVLDTESSTHAVSQRQQQQPALKTLNQVQGDGFIFNKKGFTLLELLVVVLIIGILAAVALPQYEMAVMRSRYSTLKINTKALYDAEKIYHMANGTYTSDMETLSIDLSGCSLSSDKKTCVYPWGKCIADATNGRVSCEDTQKLKNGHAIYLGVSPTNPRYGVNCWAFTSDEENKYTRLCKKEGGHFVTTGNCTNPLGVGCRIYKIAAAL